MKLWMPKKSSWCSRANHWTTRYLSSYFRLLYHVHMNVCNCAQAFWRPRISFVCIPLIINMKMTLTLSFTPFRNLFYSLSFFQFLKPITISLDENKYLFSTSLSTTVHNDVWGFTRGLLSSTLKTNDFCRSFIHQGHIWCHKANEFDKDCG